MSIPDYYQDAKPPVDVDCYYSEPISISDEPGEAAQKGQIPPHSLMAESSVLGGIILNNDGWDLISDILTSAHFYLRAHRLIFRAMESLSGKDQPIDLMTIEEQLIRTGDLEATGGIEYLVEISRNTPSIANIKVYAELVLDYAIRRSLISVSTSIAEKAFNVDDVTTIELLAHAESSVLSVGDSKGNSDNIYTMKPLLKGVLDKLDKLCQDGGTKLTGITTGFNDLDDMTSGFQSSDLIILAARPSMGKTTMALNLLENALLAENKPSILFSLEMPAEQLATKMIASLGRIDHQHLRNGTLEDEDWSKLSVAVNMMKDLNLIIDDTAGLSPNEMKSIARRIKKEHGDLGMIVVDYLQLMTLKGEDKRGSATEDISEISRSLKALAKEMKCPVVALSQLNRSLESRPNKRPVNSDLRQSGAIEQDADVIMFVYRDEVYNEDSPDKGIAEIIIGKQRNGPIGTTRLAFLGAKSRFENLTTRYNDDYN